MQNIFFPSNIKYLRNRKGLSQETMAEKLGFTRSKLNSLEQGKTNALLPEDLINFSNAFKISVDSLLKIDLLKLGELKIRDLEAGNDIYLQGGNLRVLAITVDKDNKENMEYVPIKAKAGYRSSYNDPEFIAALPRFSMPNLPKGTVRMFPIAGDSMLPIAEGSEIITTYVEDWQSIKSETPCIVILRGEQDFVFKLVSVQKNGDFLLKSTNPVYTPYTVAGADILEIWKFYKYQSAVFPEQRTELSEIKAMIDQLSTEFKSLKKG